MTVFYKLTNCSRRFDPPIYQSYLSHETFSILYKIDEWVCPLVKNTKLFVFKRLKDVDAFLKKERYNYGLSIKYDYNGWTFPALFTCEVINPEPISTIVDAGFIGEDTIKRFWNKETAYTYTTTAPKGSYSVDAVKLLKQVW